VKTANVAQGTFYYYFQTKEEILDAIIDKYINQTVEGYQTITNDPNTNAVEKITKILLFSASYRNRRSSIYQFIHEEKNAHLHAKFERRMPNHIIPQLTRIINQGIQEDHFHTGYPLEAAKAFFGTSAMIMQGIHSVEFGSNEHKQRLLAMLYFIERILGAKEDIFKKHLKTIGGEPYGFL
jgi:AcrR family transcriptional regulator